MTTQERLQEMIKANRIMLFMKGSPEQPQCGFSAQTVKILKACDVTPVHVDVLAEPDVRAELPKLSNWPTFPQLFVDGELVGGCDIATELYQNGKLQELLQTAPN